MSRTNPFKKKRRHAKRTLLVLDNDKAGEEMKKARQEAKKKGIELIENTPCLEHMFLLILGRKASGKNSTWCKSEFESNYIGVKKRDDISECKKFFPKELLEEQRLKIPELNKLISLMEGK